MKKVDGILPVYQHKGKVYLEFPRSVWGREVLISAQIDRGFDLVNRPAKSLGVVRVKVDDNKQVTLAQPSYADRMPEAFKEAVISGRRACEAGLGIQADNLVAEASSPLTSFLND